MLVRIIDLKLREPRGLRSEMRDKLWALTADNARRRTSADSAIVDFTQDAKAYSPLRSRSAVLPPGPVAVFTDSETNSFHLYAPQLSRI